MRRSLCNAVTALLLSNLFLPYISWGGVGAPKIVTTIYPISDWVYQIAGDAFEIINIVDNSNHWESHYLIPSRIQQIVKTDMIVLLGVADESWIAPVIEKTPGVRLVIISHGIDLIDSEDTASSDERYSKDVWFINGQPAVWMDVRYAMIMVESLFNALSNLFPSYRGTFRQNADAYLDSLEALDIAVSSRIHRFKDRRLYCLDNGLAYFAQRYGLKIDRSAYINPMAGISGKGARRFWEILVKQDRPAVFFYTNPKSALIYETTLGSTENLKFVDVLGSPYDDDTYSYIRMIERCLTQIEDVLT